MVNWVKTLFDWQLLENVIGAPDVLNQYFRKYIIRLDYDVLQQYKKQHPDEL